MDRSTEHAICPLKDGLATKGGGMRRAERRQGARCRSFAGCRLALRRGARASSSRPSSSVWASAHSGAGASCASRRGRRAPRSPFEPMLRPGASQRSGGGRKALPPPLSYAGFTAKHLRERLGGDRGFGWNGAWTRARRCASTPRVAPGSRDAGRSLSSLRSRAQRREVCSAFPDDERGAASNFRDQ